MPDTILETNTWPVNELGEILVQTGVGTTDVVGYVPSVAIPSDPTTNKAVFKMPFDVATTCTFATLPAASAGIITAFVTDVGTHGSFWRSNGTNWGIVGGHVVLEQSAVALAATTGTTSEVAILARTIKGGLMGPNGAIEVQLKFTHTNNANTKTRRVRIGGSGVSGSEISGNPQSSSNATTHVNVRFENRNSEASQLGSNGSVNYTASTNAFVTRTENTAVDFLLTVTDQLGNSADSSVLEAYKIILYRP